MEPIYSTPTLRDLIAERARSMSGWLKFVGVVTLLAAVPYALTIVGLVFAWLPGWLGVLLIQAGNAADRGTDEELLRMIEKLRIYFIVQGVLIILALVAFTIFFILFGTVFFEMMRDIGSQGPTWEA